MGQKKGQTGNPKGRPKGVPNKVTGTVKEWIQQVIDGNRKRFEKDLLALEPAERVKAISGLICYVLPKQQSVSIQEQINAEYDALERLIENAPDEATYISLTFEKGIAVALNGEKMSQREILEKLNEIGGQHGIGIIDIVENRVVGMKSRGVYETPGGTILMEAHQQLEELILDRETLKYKRLVSVEFAELVYAAKWFSPLREALTAFVDKTQEYVTGTTNFRLYKGNIIKEGTTSPYSLYDEDIASFKTGDLYDHHDAEGFITLYGLSTKVRAMKLNNKK